MINYIKIIRRRFLLNYVRFVKFLLSNILYNIFNFLLFKTRWKYLLYYNFIDNHRIINKINNNLEYKFYSLSRMTQSRYNNFLKAEPYTIKWIDGFPKGKIFWDIGSNVGLFAIYYAKKNNNNKVISFEPSVFNLEILARNIFLNNLTKNISIFPLPLNKSSEINDFNMNNTEYGGALSGFGVDYDENFNKRDINFKYSTFGMSLDKLIEIYNLEIPHFIKIDVDGIEELILEGSKKLFNDKNLNSVLVENPNNLESISNFFKKFNFVLKEDIANVQIWERNSSN